MSEEILINGKKITELSDMFFEYCKLKKENEELKSRNANLRLNLATYDLPEIKKVLTDWRTGELDKKFKKLQKENEELKDENSHKSCLIWYIFNCSKVETIQRLLYEYYECINDDRYNKKRVKKFWDDVFHLRLRRKYKSNYKQALEEIREMLKIAEKTKSADKHFEYMDNALNKCNKVLND